MARPKTIQFPKRSYHSKNQSILAVAYATAQQPGRGWEGNDVSNDIAQWLDEAGCPILLPRISEAVRWLDQRGYGARVMQGQRIRQFILDPDVVVPEPDFVKAARLADLATFTIGDTPADAAPAEPAPAPAAAPAKPPRVVPPVPHRGLAEPEWMPQLHALLVQWWSDEPAQADAWAQTTIACLGGAG